MASALLEHKTETREGAAPIVLAAAATGLVDFIERQGGDVDSIFGNSGIAPDMAGAPTLKLKLASYCRLFEQAAKQIEGDKFSPAISACISVSNSSRATSACGAMRPFPPLPWAALRQSGAAVPFPPGILRRCSSPAAKTG